MPIDIPGRPPTARLLGYSGLIEEYQLKCPVPRRLTAIAATSQKVAMVREGIEWIFLPKGLDYRIPATRIEHLGAALKHEGVDLRVLRCLFQQDVAQELIAYVGPNSAGIYTRRAWFLYEWITGSRLPIEDSYGAHYVPVLDPIRYFARRGVRSKRHKVENNLPGVPGFCPLIRRTERLSDGRIDGLAAEARDFVLHADPAVLRIPGSSALLVHWRCWMTLFHRWSPYAAARTR